MKPLDLLLKLTFIGLLIQNLMILASLLVGESNLDDSALFLNALKLDLVIFLILLVLALAKLVETRQASWILVIVGSGLFVYFALYWRVTLGLLTDLPFDSSQFDLNTQTYENFNQGLSDLLTSIQTSNLGLLLTSIGLFLAFPKAGFTRSLLLFYGIINLLLTMLGLLVVFKIFTPVLIIPWLLVMITSDWETQI